MECETAVGRLEQDWWMVLSPENPILQPCVMIVVYQDICTIPGLAERVLKGRVGGERCIYAFSGQSQIDKCSHFWPLICVWYKDLFTEYQREIGRGTARVIIVHGDVSPGYYIV
jgi:hypothetical protein